MIVPDAANIPPTPWHTEIFAPGICAGAIPRICRTLSCSAYMPYMPECIYDSPPPLVFSGSLLPGAVFRSAMKRPASPRGTKPQVLQSVQRQMREGVVDHQVIHVLVRDACLAKGRRPRNAERARTVKLSIWLTIGVSTLSPVPRM